MILYGIIFCWGIFITIGVLFLLHKNANKSSDDAFTPKLNNLHSDILDLEREIEFYQKCYNSNFQKIFDDITVIEKHMKFIQEEISLLSHSNHEIDGESPVDFELYIDALSPISSKLDKLESVLNTYFIISERRFRELYSMGK
jgi:hypothetical protein